MRSHNLSARQTKTCTCANSVDQMRRVVTRRLIRIYTVCHSVLDFGLKPLFASVDKCKFKNRRVYSRNSGMKGLTQHWLSVQIPQRMVLSNIHPACRNIATRLHERNSPPLIRSKSKSKVITSAAWCQNSRASSREKCSSDIFQSAYPAARSPDCF